MDCLFSSPVGLELRSSQETTHQALFGHVGLPLIRRIDPGEHVTLVSGCFIAHAWCSNHAALHEIDVVLA